MAIKHLTQAAPAAAVTQVTITPATDHSPQPELKISIWKACGGHVNFVGSRAQLEEEGLIPTGFDWPLGCSAISWKHDGWSCLLKRMRPDGRKQIKAWRDADHWLLMRSESKPPQDRRQAELNDAAAEFAAAAFRASPQGRREDKEQFERYWHAFRDEGFQAFKAAVLPRRRKPGQPSSEVQS